MKIQGTFLSSRVGRRIFWTLLLVIWTAFGLLLAGQQTIASTLRGAPVPWSTSLFQWMPVAYGWALATPAILWLGRRFPFRHGTWRRSALVHAIACCVLVFVLSLGYTLHVVHLLPASGAGRPPFDRAVQLFVAWVLWDAFLYWAVLSVGSVADNERRASRLETQLVEAELDALKMQLQPHFLFNALHTIGSLVRSGDREHAVRVVAGLGRRLYEVPVGFKWFVPGLVDASLCFGGEESAGASFLRRDGSVWTTDKDGPIMDLLAAEITARTGKDPGEHYGELTAELGTPYYTRLDAAATPAQKAQLGKLSADAVKESRLAGEPIVAKLTRAPGNDAPLGGLKVVAASGWFAARPSGTENIYKIYAESLKDQTHLSAIVSEAQRIVTDALS